ncbi:MAG: aldehyde dehydrogenase family protein [Halobacteria archaeon]|nr:aldehyde dehydrogenase family protein [Halobacteria archaeon]
MSKGEQTERFSTDADWNAVYIDGEWYKPEGSESIKVSDPMTQEVFAEVPACDEGDVTDAFNAAEEAQEDWGARPVEERQEILTAAKNEMMSRMPDVKELLAVEAGSTVPKQMGEVNFSRGIMDWMADFDDFETEHESTFEGKTNRVVREPVGVVATVCPWNFPLYMAMRAVAPALVAGNSVVLKPSTETPITGGLAVARLFEEAGLPGGVLNVVTGRGSDIGDAVVSDPRAESVNFTGSTDIGRRVGRLAGDNVAEVALELGGNCPYVVTDDADLEWAVTAGLFGTFMHQGQICVSINRHVVHEDVYDEYVERFVERTEELGAGEPQDASNVVGPVINESQRDQIIEFIERSVEAGATLETGGNADGLLVEPTVLSDATNQMAASCNEHFGPVAPIIPVEDDDEAVEVANDTGYGLSAAVHCQDHERARELADRIESGMVHINDQPMHDEPHMPFGGVKMSGVGRFNGEWVIEEMTETKWISEQDEPRDYLVF